MKTASKRKTTAIVRHRKAKPKVQALAKIERPTVAEAIEKVLIQGDLSPLTVEERLDYYKKLCVSLGLNPLTCPFDYIVYQGKLKLYAKKDCTEQLRKVHGISVTKSTQEMDAELCTYHVEVRDRTGRTDTGTGVVAILGLKGLDRANAIMKCETKAKRRATLSIAGLGMLDESELDYVEDHNMVTPGGRVIIEQGSTGSLEAASAVAQRKLDAHAAGEPINPPKPPVEQREPGEDVPSGGEYMRAVFKDHKDNTVLVTLEIKMDEGMASIAITAAVTELANLGVKFHPTKQWAYIVEASKVSAVKNALEKRLWEIVDEVAPVPAVSSDSRAALITKFRAPSGKGPGRVEWQGMEMSFFSKTLGEDIQKAYEKQQMVVFGFENKPNKVEGQPPYKNVTTFELAALQQGER